MKTRAVLLAVLAPPLLALAACGGDGGNGGVASAGGAKSAAAASPHASTDPQDAQLKFAQCLRQHGVHIDDPAPGKPLRITAKKGDNVDMDAAQKACVHFLQDGGVARTPDAKEFDRMVKLARCLREHGLDAPDPKPGEGMRVRVDEHVDQAKAEAAQRECEAKYPEGR